MNDAAFMLRAVGTMLRRPTGTVRLPRLVLSREVRIEGRAVRAYAALCGFTPAQGVPVTYPHVLGFPLQMALMMGRGFPFPLPGLVHLHNRIVQHVALGDGDRLNLEAGATRLVAHARGQGFVIAVTARRGGGIVWQGESLYLHRSTRHGQGKAAPASPEIGLARRLGTFEAPADIGRRYARVSGDANPIHTNAVFARLMGFRHPIAHGMWSLARAVALLTPQAALAEVELEAGFRSPLFLPGQAELRVRGSDFEITAPGGHPRFLCGHLVARACFVRKPC